VPYLFPTAIVPPENIITTKTIPYKPAHEGPSSNNGNAVSIIDKKACPERIQRSYRIGTG
jgi:hypothetical protein